MNTDMAPSNGMSSLITDAMTASQRLRPKLAPLSWNTMRQ